MKICTYILTSDIGLAPNPFWGICTLAVCTPNHSRARLEQSDWIAGFYSACRGGGLVYAMRLTEDPLSFDDYFRSPRFERKKPDIKGSWRKQVGDNFYYKNERGEYEQYETLHHKGEILKDTKGNRARVFISDDFYYFGVNRNKFEIPYPASKVEQVIRKNPRGIKYVYDQAICSAFVDWLRSEGTRWETRLPIDSGKTGTCD